MAARLGQIWTKGQTGSKCTQERVTASTVEKPKRRVARACAYTYRCVEHRGTTTIHPASLRVWYNTGWECGSEARVTEALSALDKDRTGSKRTQDEITVLHEFCTRLNREPKRVAYEQVQIAAILATNRTAAHVTSRFREIENNVEAYFSHQQRRLLPEITSEPAQALEVQRHSLWFKKLRHR